ncbi:hypothetical protein GCM10010960_14760 [Arenimonas maotaiensis]|uniref:Uncharacterized protein n=1 Tax=Arenimonas maotaiensis TaxID=1446479 RepID=A0A917CQN0_9GAMM|nr:hypothetical protein [Arenimonas maotaiensis]GGF94061.1 hypothetical protein GCM10010960_14760 [Arenimonas maotaiensis]
MVSIIDHPQLAERPEMVKSALAVLFGPERAAAFIDRLGEKEPAEVTSGRLRSDTAILARTLRAQGFRVEVSERGAVAGPG